MNSWKDPKAKQKAKEAFREELLANKALRDDCVKSPILARAKFAQIGEFQLAENLPTGEIDPDAIPFDVEFRIFEEDIAQRDKLVVLVLRENPPGIELQDPDRAWQCTYNPY